MTADSVSHSAEIEALMLSLSPGAKLAYNTGKQFTYTVPLASGDVAQVFNTMETSRRAHGIVDWGITQASLEEVFIKVVTAWEDESLNVTRLAERHRPSLVGDQLRAREARRGSGLAGKNGRAAAGLVALRGGM
jgi:hypothetical protein